MKRSGVSLDAVADWHNLSAAFHRAALGKGHRTEVIQFKKDLPNRLANLRKDILAGTVTVGQMRCFHIRDPKPRIIHAPCFPERVLHHALMAPVGPVLDRGLVADTYACRTGKGALAAVRRAQHHLQRWPWYAKIDIRSYFANIDHAILGELLARRFNAHHAAPGKGLPIGALTSQQFANYYLSGLDRLLLEACRVRGFVRYMDDIVWWGGDRESVRDALVAAGEYAHSRLGLEIKQPVQVGQSRHGLSFCGYRILPGRLLLSRRRKRRYAECRQHWETAYRDGVIDALGLQSGYASAYAITAHADATAWRREQLRRSPLDADLALV